MTGKVYYTMHNTFETFTAGTVQCKEIQNVELNDSYDS